MTNIHNYDAETGAYLSTAKAGLDPLDRKPMVPANATLIAPPEAGEKEVPVWVDDAWTIKPDHRGAEYWLADRSHHTVTEIGEVPPANALDEEPPKPLEELKADALVEARGAAALVRSQIAGAATTERALGWVLKALFAGVWQINAQAANPLLQPLADVAAHGFGIETELTGENPEAIRDRSVEKAGAFFLALQLVEGMERVAETLIGGANTAEALEGAITQLRALEAQALTKLAALSKGGTNHARAVSPRR